MANVVDSGRVLVRLSSSLRPPIDPLRLPRIQSLRVSTVVSSQNGNFYRPSHSVAARTAIFGQNAAKSNVIATKQNLDQDIYLFGEKKVSFSDLGIQDELVQVLSARGYVHATTIQSKAIPIINQGQDVIIGAETGSGKTLAYLLPIVNKVMADSSARNIAKETAVNAKDAKDLPEDAKKDMESTIESSNDEPTIRKYPAAVILLPNKDLCGQVMEVAMKFMGFVNTDVTIGFAPPVESRVPYPDIVVCTPSFFNRFVRGSSILNPEIFRSVKQVVLDEADMLLEGSYLKDIEDILGAFKVVRRTMIREGSVHINENTVQHILSAATIPSYGLRSIDNYIAERYPRVRSALKGRRLLSYLINPHNQAIKISQEYFHEHHPRITQNFIKMDKALLSAERIDTLVNCIYSVSLNDDNTITMQSSSISDDSSAISKIPSTMIFVNTAQTAQDLTFFLRKKQVECVEYHKLISDDDRKQNLDRFKDGDVRVLICTDAASRGLDLPNVKHVIQAEFALNVVQHLHRIGRSSRAGAIGYATNFYDDAAVQLVSTILPSTRTDGQQSMIHQSEEATDLQTKEKQAKSTLEQAFSRRRGLRQKQKRFERKMNASPIESIVQDKDEGSFKRKSSSARYSTESSSNPWNRRPSPKVETRDDEFIEQLVAKSSKDDNIVSNDFSDDDFNLDDFA